jgi:predicted ATP-grasp superfamily ATP-dependent carboligase
MATTRIYKVTDAQGKEAPRLIEATSQPAAIGVVASRYKAEAVNAKEVAEMMTAGVKVEQAAAAA